ncbi:MAG: S8 family peptidase [Dehalococcoidia bacterium]|nr:S8 family peptidase [Dehalococcoidia bacterium]
MEWLVESDEFDSDPDEDFRKSTAHPESAVPTRLYFVMADRQSIKELERLWKLYAKHAEGEEFKWPRGQTLWRDMFSHLKDIHFWGPEERVPDSLLTDWQQRLGQGADTVLAQIELWFRDDRAIRERAENSVVDLVGRAGGEVLARSIIPAISYHAILASLPRATVSQVVQHEGVALTLADGIMFLNAVGQSCFPVSDTDVSVQITTPPSDLPSGNPRLAILDGLPLSKHALLDGRLQEDDPEDWSSGYPAAVRQHGTAMASIAIHGDLSSPFTPLSTPVYIRPVMKPRETVDGQEEAVPEDELDVDLLHRAIRRLFQPTPTEPAAAPSVKIINYSICNRNRPFDRLLSPMAHLLDWLAFTYNFLPIISAGNCPRDIDLPCSPDSFRSLAPEEQDKTIVSALWNDAPNRRILAPAEAVNAISVAALHTDSSVASRAQAHISDVLTSAIFPSPINPLGFGYRRAIKPDVLAPGGRLLYEDAYPANTHAIKPIVESVLPPGIRVASPGKIPGNLTVESHTRGTSNSAALVSSLATRVCELLDHFAEPIPDDYLAVIIKAFVVHSARWPDCQQALTHLGPSRQVIPRFAGYGAVDYDRALFCTDERVTLFRWGILGSDESDLYSLPLPPALSGKRIAKRLTVTLAWLTPINCQHRYYRRAALSFQPEHLDLLDLDRSGVDFNFAGRGTVQHEVFEGRRAAPFLDGSSLTLRVNCRAHAGDLDDQIRYGIVVTLETADPHPIPIYDEIDIRIRPAIRV